MDANVMVDYHTQKKFLRVIIYHNTLIQGQYIYNNFLQATCVNINDINCIY